MLVEISVVTAFPAHGETSIVARSMPAADDIAARLRRLIAEAS